MKYILFFSLFVSQIVVAQKHFTKTGVTTFTASVETFEPIAAKNESTTVLLNTTTGDIAALLFVKAFHFDIALMQEHFNENYMESDQYPKATFKGQLIDFNVQHLSTKDTQYQLKGVLTIRGKNSIINTLATFKKENNTLILTANFQVKPAEFDIKIPSIVRTKIANSINIHLNYELIEKK